jgi:hypothetical protein
MAHRGTQTPFVAVLAIAGLLVLAPLGANAKSDGSITGVTTSGGCDCHGGVDANGDVSAIIDSMDGNFFNDTATTEIYTLTISRAGSNLTGTGIDIAVSDDDAGFDAFLGESSTDTNIVDSEVTHAQENAGLFTYQFSVTAPVAMSLGSTLTLTAVGLEYSSGGPGGPTANDSWDFAAPFAVTVIPVTVPEPTTGLLFGLGLVGLTVSGRKRA